MKNIRRLIFLLLLVTVILTLNLCSTLCLYLY